MTGATAKSKPTSSKIDEKEHSRLQRRDYWLQVTRAKLVMDLIFVCMLIYRLSIYTLKIWRIQHMICSRSNMPGNQWKLSVVLRQLFSGTIEYLFSECCFSSQHSIYSSAKLYDRHKSILLKAILWSIFWFHVDTTFVKTCFWLHGPRTCFHIVYLPALQRWWHNGICIWWLRHGLMVYGSSSRPPPTWWRSRRYCDVKSSMFRTLSIAFLLEYFNFGLQLPHTLLCFFHILFMRQSWLRELETLKHANGIRK
jgi:hypothetical protein